MLAAFGAETDLINLSITALPSDVLTDADVDRYADQLVAKGQAALTSMSHAQTLQWIVGHVSPILGFLNRSNAVTEEQVVGALKSIVAVQIPRWRADGHAKVAKWTADYTTWTPDEEGNWRAAGAAFDQALGEIPGFFVDAGLMKTVWSTGAQTALDAPAAIAAAAQKVADKVTEIIPWQLWATLAGLAGLAVWFQFGRKR